MPLPRPRGGGGFPPRPRVVANGFRGFTLQGGLCLITKVHESLW